MLRVYLCVFQRYFHLWIFSEILMNPNPFLRKQFVSDKLCTRMRETHLRLSMDLSCHARTQSHGITRRQKQNTHTLTHSWSEHHLLHVWEPHTHTNTSTHWNRVQKPQRGCNQASWQVYPSDTSIAEDKPRAFPRISQIHAFMRVEWRWHCFSPLSSIIKCELSASLESYKGVRFYDRCHRDPLES